MKARIRFVVLLLSLSIVLAAASVLTQAQVIMNSPSTVGQSYAEGYADVISAHGAANLSNSQAAINLEQAAKLDMENREQWTQTYFDMRKVNRAAREQERGKRPTMEDVVRYAAMGKPQRLSPSELDTVTGKIHWPSLLQADLFTPQRNTLQGIFEQRAKYGTANFDQQMTIRSATGAMLGYLKDQIRNIPPPNYVAAKRFLESLAYEGQLPTG